jgi:hypothetical protein
VDVDIGGGDSLDGDTWSVSEPVGGSHVDSHIFLSYIEIRESGEHERIVVLLLGVLVLQSDYLEALPADLASVHGSLSDEVEHLFVRVRVIFNTWTHANNYSPRTV